MISVTVEEAIVLADPQLPRVVGVISPEHRDSYASTVFSILSNTMVDTTVSKKGDDRDWRPLETGALLEPPRLSEEVNPMYVWWCLCVVFFIYSHCVCVCVCV